MAANYRPMSLLSVCYKLLERLSLHRISPTVEGLLSPDQAGFQKGRSTCDQVAAVTTFIENGFQQNLKTGAFFLDLTAAYDTVWHTGLLYKLSKSMRYWFIQLVGLLLRDRRFRVHMGNDTSSWRPQRNGLPQGSVLGKPHTNKLRQFMKFYDDFDESSLAAQLTILHDAISNRVQKQSAVERVTVFEVANVLKNMDGAQQLLDQVWRLTKLPLVVPATSATAERSFSALHHVMIYLRATIGQTPLNSALILHCHQDRADSLTHCCA